MKRCECCKAALPSGRLCPPCAQSMSVATNRAELACVLHGRTISWGAWDNHPVEL